MHGDTTAVAVFQLGEYTTESVMPGVEAALMVHTNCFVQSRHVSGACISVSIGANIANERISTKLNCGNSN